MKAKERMMLAVNRQKPDRLPVTCMDLMPAWRNVEMGGMDALSCWRELGLDASYFAPNPCFWPYDTSMMSEDWRVEYTCTQNGENIVHDYVFKTPKGILTMQQAQNQYTTWVTKHLVKKPEDILLLKYMPVGRYDHHTFRKMYDELGDDGILRTNGYGFQEGCWQDACEMYGVENMIMATYDDPEWVHEFLEILLQNKLKFIETSCSGLKVDLILNGGGAASNTVISPDIHRAFCLPYDKQLHHAIQSYGHKVVYHTCGGMTKILDCIVENGCDVSESLSTKGAGGDIEDPKEVVDVLGGKVAMQGGMDQVAFLPNASAEAIRKEVSRLFEGFGQNGGYIMMTSDHFFHCGKRKILDYVAAAKECVY